MKYNAGIDMSEEELAEWVQSFKDIEESIELVMKNGEDLWTRDNTVKEQERRVLPKEKQAKQ